jgi:SAM-dependent methyltransferase
VCTSDDADTRFAFGFGLRDTAQPVSEADPRGLPTWASDQVRSSLPVHPEAMYDTIGRGYPDVRRPDARIASIIWAALGDAATVVNVGAGAGSYEPEDREVIAVEPSALMIAQRPADAAPVVQAVAEALPLADGGVDAAMAVLTLQHWDDPGQGLRELIRVARRHVVLVTMDVDVLGELWLIRDYLPETLAQHAVAFPSIAELLCLLPGATSEAIPVPRDCSDGFMAAFWGRPEAYLDPRIRAATSPWHQLPAEAVDRALDRLARDLASGAWDQRYGQLRQQQELDVGLRLVHADVPASAHALEGQQR